MKRSIGVALMLACTAGILWAQQTVKKDGPDPKAAVEKKTERPVDPRDARQKPIDTRLLESAPKGMPPEMLRPPMQQQQLMMMQEQMASKRRDFELYSAELKAIRKVALQEKAKKTVEHIDKLLERKEKEFATENKTSEDRVKQMQEQADRAAKERSMRLEKQRDAGITLPEVQKEKPAKELPKEKK
jgi:hypothetical protein